MQAVGVSGLRSPSRQAKHSCTEQRRRSRATVSCRALTVFSPSKVNLFLRITRRREDGFHDLASLFHVIDLGDTLEFNPTEAEADSLKCNVSDVPTDASNLVIKALDLFRKHTGAPNQLPTVLPNSLPFQLCSSLSRTFTSSLQYHRTDEHADNAWVLLL